MIKFNIPYVSGKELAYIEKTITSKSFAGGKTYTKLCQEFFEEEYNFNKCYLTSSCTSAIEMAALILDLKPNDEIIIPSFTFASCPNPFLISGAKVVLADCEKNYPNISSNHVKSLITKNTKALMVMHYGGFGCDMDEIRLLCNKHNLYLIEDAAQSIHSYYNNNALGSYGDLSVFSFHETKNIHCGEGGMLVVNNKSLTNKAEIVRQYGTNRVDFLNGKVSHYESVGLGLSFFQSELNAAFLFAQLQEIENVTNKRKELWELYHSNLNIISSNETFKLCDESVIKNSNAHNFFIILSENINIDNFLAYLNKKEVQAVKHFYPLHLSKLHQNNSSEHNDFPNTNQLNKKLVRLPLHTYLTPKDINYITQIIIEYFSK